MTTTLPRSGQVILITVLVLGVLILSVITISGLLVIFQIRQTTFFADSAKAIFAADAGIEWALYDFSCNVDPMDAKVCVPKPVFSNGANVNVTIDAVSIKSIGEAGKASRAFLLNLQ